MRNVAAAQLKSKVPLIERPVLKMNMSTYGVQKVGEHNFGEYRLNVFDLEYYIENILELHNKCSNKISLPAQGTHL